MKPLTLALALGALYLLTRDKEASAASGAGSGSGPINTRLVARGELTSPQGPAPDGFMWQFDFERGEYFLRAIDTMTFQERMAQAMGLNDTGRKGWLPE